MKENFLAPLEKKSIAMQVSHVEHANAGHAALPMMGKTSAEWLDEGEELTVENVPFNEIRVPHMNAGKLLTATRQLLNDSAYDLPTLLSNSLIDAYAELVDKTFFGTTTPKGPKGIESVSGRTIVEADEYSLDPFLDALGAVEAERANPRFIVMGPELATKLRKLKVSAGSNQYILQSDPGSAWRNTIAGIPVLTCADVAAETAHLIDPDYVFMSVREDVEVEADASTFFTSVRTAIRSFGRIGWVFPRPEKLAAVKFNVTP
ncbi:hypothetical protein AXK58_20130 [Tsukamurella tyrosinosolvens]|nr:hypothetical protein AXK58_20130 [Tsukamurella tyrosinosolvens]